MGAMMRYRIQDVRNKTPRRTWTEVANGTFFHFVGIKSAHFDLIKQERLSQRNWHPEKGFNFLWTLL